VRACCCYGAYAPADTPRAGDLSHLASIFILLHRMHLNRSCRGAPDAYARLFVADACTGISFKTQALYATVFVTRYIDLFTNWVSLYNFVMKLFFICSSCYTLYLMRTRFRSAQFSWPVTSFVR
jgi:ER lumen protein retaining receptor